MNLRKTVARVAALALLATPVAVIASSEGAQAATVATHGTTVRLNPVRAIIYGSSTYITGSVTDSTTGQSVYEGTVTLEARSYGSSAWRPIASDSAGGYVLFDIKPAISTQYQLVYSGGDNGYDTKWTGNHSSSVVAPVARKLTLNSRGLHLWGKVAPATKLKLVFKKKAHGKYKKWFKVKTNKKGKWSTHLHGRVGTKVEIIIPASGGYVGAVQTGSIV